MRACGHCASATLRDKMVASGQTLMAVTAQLPWAAHLMDRPFHEHDRAAGSRAATAYGSQLAASLAGRGWSVISGGAEETDVHGTVTSLNWQGDAAPAADFNPLRYALEMAVCSCLASMERAAGDRAAKQARGLPTGRPAKLNATTRAGAVQRIGDGAIPEQVAADLGISRSTLYRELRKHREGAAAEQAVREG